MFWKGQELTRGGICMHLEWSEPLSRREVLNTTRLAPFIPVCVESHTWKALSAAENQLVAFLSEPLSDCWCWAGRCEPAVSLVSSLGDVRVRHQHKSSPWGPPGHLTGGHLASSGRLVLSPFLINCCNWLTGLRVAGLSESLLQLGTHPPLEIKIFFCWSPCNH